LFEASHEPAFGGGTIAEPVYEAMVGAAIEAPQAGIANVCLSWTEMMAEQPEQPRQLVGVRHGVGDV
jgi:hypothetical protein